VRAPPFSLLALTTVAVAACACSFSSSSPGPSTRSASGAGAAAVTEPNSSIVAADSLANTQIGGPDSTVLAFRFRAQWTGVVRAVRFYVVVNSEGRVGYSGGTGGTLRVTLAPDSNGPRGVASYRLLATATVGPPSRDAWPLVRFAKPARVVARRYYRVVFTNADRDPRRNFVSVNALLAYGHREPMPRIPDGMSVLLGDSADGGRTARAWEPRPQRPGDRYAPILDVVGGRANQHLGLGYMEVWSSNPKPIGGSAMVRQLLGTAAGRTITGAWLRVRRRDGATAPLQLRIERPDGGVLTSASVPASAVATGSPEWVHARFGKPAAIKSGERIALTAAASQESSYEAFPIRKGTEFGFDRRTVFTGGYAQFGEGDGWVGWDQWGQPNRRDGDLQFALDTAGR
jgi:hypothetical protein